MLEGGHKVARRNIGDFCDITKGFLAKVFMLQTFWKLELKTTTTKMLFFKRNAHQTWTDYGLVAIYDPLSIFISFIKLDKIILRLGNG